MTPVSHVVDSQETPRDIESPRLHQPLLRCRLLTQIGGRVVEPALVGIDALMRMLATVTADGLLHPRPPPGAEMA